MSTQSVRAFSLPSIKYFMVKGVETSCNKLAVYRPPNWKTVYGYTLIFSPIFAHIAGGFDRFENLNQPEVVQVSLQTELGPAHHYRLGQALAPLAADEVLLIGSGQMTHNLREWGRNFDGQPAPYVEEFQAWVHDRIVAREHEALMNYRDSAPHGVRSHPSDEHFLPLFFALGAGGEQATPLRTYNAIEGSVLAMDLYTFTQTDPPHRTI